VKNVRQIELLRRAGRITMGIYACVKRHIKPGVTERYVVRLIEGCISELGLRRSFRTIVASGPNAADPHAPVTDRKIRQGDTVVVDFGVIYKGYHSDMTRTVLVGKVDRMMKDLYRTVSRAQKQALRDIKVGIRISELTRAAHGVMRRKGYGKNILHTLGHGVGVRIHEAPKLSERNRRRIYENTVCTIEPGLYIKGKGGVRIEDMVVVGKRTKEVLTR